MLKTSRLCIFCAVFSKLFRELFGRPFFTCQKYFVSAIFAQGTPLLYGACLFNSGRVTVLCSVTPDRGPLFCAKRSVFSLNFGLSAGTELGTCGCFSGSTRDTPALASLVAATPIPVSLADA